MSGASSPVRKKLKTELLMKIVAVLADDYTATVDLEAAVVCDITDKKATSNLVRQLSISYPFPSRWSHLKRIKCTNLASGHELHSILICPLDEDLQQSSVVLSKGKLFSSGRVDINVLGDPYVAVVPRCPPLTRSQFDICRKHWATAFHEDKYIVRMMSDEIFSQDELLVHKNHLDMALDFAIDSQAAGGLPVACLIVDPVSKAIVAKATDQRHSHPLQHAVMVCIDAVARQQGGGAWIPSDGTTVVDHTLSSNGTIPADIKVPYLCTGLDAFISREPCIMCAMALLHSRIKRVFYRIPYKDGALGSRYKLHVTKGLNHHFEVFRGSVSENSTDEVSLEEHQPT